MSFKSFKALGIQSIVFGMGGVLTQVVGFILVPLYAHFLTPAEYGVVNILNITATVISIFAQLGFGSAVFKSVLYDQEHDKETIYSTAFFALLVTGILTTLLGLVFSVQWSSLLLASPNYSYLVVLTFFTSALDTSVMILTLAKLRVESKPVIYSALSFGAFFLRLLLNILFVAVWRRGANGLVEANTIQSVVFTFIYLIFLHDVIRPRFSLPELKNMAAFGIPLIPGALAINVMVLADRYFLRVYRDLSEVGVYSIGYRIGGVMTLLISAFQVAWPAFFFQQAKEKDNRQFYSRALTYLVFIGTYLSLGLSALAQDTLIIVTTPAYYGAYKVVPLISLSYLLYGAYQITIIGPSLTRKTYLSSAIIGISAIVQTVLNFIIIPRYGMIGAGWTTLLSYALLIVLSVIVSNRIFPMTYEYLRLGKMMIMAGLLYLLSRLVVIQSPYVSFIVRGLIAGSFPIALFLTGFYNREEIRVLQIQVRKLVDRLLRRKPALSNIAEKENPD